MERFVRFIWCALVLWCALGHVGSWAQPPKQASITLEIDPLVLTVQPDQEFAVSVYVDSGDTSVDGVQVTLSFDPVHLLVLELIPGSALPDVFPPPSTLPDGYDNSEGRISYAAGKLFGDLPSGRFEVFTIRFRALEPTEGTMIRFVDEAGLPPNKVTYSGQDLGVELLGGAVTIASPEATATLTPLPTETPVDSPTPTATDTDTPLPTDTQVTEATATPTDAAYPGPQTTATWTVRPTNTSTPTPAPALPTSTRLPATATPTSRRDAAPTTTSTPTPLNIPTEAPLPTVTFSPVSPAPPSVTPTEVPTMPDVAKPAQATATPTATETLPGPQPTEPPAEEGTSLWQAVKANLGALIAILLIAGLALGFAIARRRWLAE